MKQPSRDRDLGLEVSRDAAAASFSVGSFDFVVEKLESDGFWFNWDDSAEVVESGW